MVAVFVINATHDAFHTKKYLEDDDEIVNVPINRNVLGQNVVVDNVSDAIQENNASNTINSKKEKTSDTNKLKMKKKLFISYASENLKKVDLIVKELKNHPHFEPLVVANNREPNKALIKKVTSGIKSSYRVIVLLTKESITSQWINQEIGFAFGEKIPVIAIIEQSLLDNDRLKGFIHKQNDCPYKYPTRTGLLMREENKGFMAVFRLLIKDLENNLELENDVGHAIRGKV